MQQNEQGIFIFLFLILSPFLFPPLFLLIKVASRVALYQLWHFWIIQFCLFLFLLHSSPPLPSLSSTFISLFPLFHTQTISSRVSFSSLSIVVILDSYCINFSPYYSLYSILPSLFFFSSPFSSFHTANSSIKSKLQLFINCGNSGFCKSSTKPSPIKSIINKEREGREKRRGRVEGRVRLSSSAILDSAKLPQSPPVNICKN